jgi:hypothetical protein
LDVAFRALRSAVAGKDPRRIGVAPCSLALSFPGHGQLTMHVRPRKIEVDRGDTRSSRERVPSALLRSPLEVWSALSRGRLRLEDAPIEIFGEPGVLGAIGKLVSGRRDPIAIRNFE